MARRRFFRTARAAAFSTCRLRRTLGGLARRLTEKRTDSLDDVLDGRLTPQANRGIDDIRPDTAIDRARLWLVAEETPCEGGADRSGKALPAAGIEADSSERSAPDVDLNLNQLPGATKEGNLCLRS